jgi:type IV pilus assembly protein PilA
MGVLRMKKKGFTLIELMIVLAIISILAVVLVPKAGILKGNAKDAGVFTNVNTMRAFLETKTSNDTILAADTLRTAIDSAFTSPNNLTNPHTKLSTVASGTANVASTALTSTDAGAAIAVYNSASLMSAATVAGVSGNKGTVFVYRCTDGYIVFGVDNSGTVVGTTQIK